MDATLAQILTELFRVTVERDQLRVEVAKLRADGVQNMRSGPQEAPGSPEPPSPAS